MGINMLGYAHAAGLREGPRNDAGTIARYFVLPVAKVVAAVLYPSVWSKAYSRFENQYGRVNRDFHYQALSRSVSLNDGFGHISQATFSSSQCVRPALRASAARCDGATSST